LYSAFLAMPDVPHTDQETSEPDDRNQVSNSNPPGNPVQQQREQPEHETTQHHNTPAEHEKSVLCIRIYRGLRKASRNATVPEWITAFLTLAIVGVGVLQACIYWQQKKIMESGGGQTDQLICAANIQAAAAEQNATSATSIATAAGTQAQAAADTSTAFKNQLQLFRDVSHLVGGGAQVRLPTWIGLYSFSVKYQHSPIGVGFRVINDGTGPATHVTIADRVAFRATPPRGMDKVFRYPTDFVRPIGELPLNKLAQPTVLGDEKPFLQRYDDTITATPEDYAAYNAGTKKLYVWGEIRYLDVSDELQKEKFCRFVSATDVREVPIPGVNLAPDKPGGWNGRFHECEPE
jgi:hypothetical protein